MNKVKVMGLFRGFPGLGRVISGIEILESLRDEYGCEVQAFSYLQGEKYLRSRKDCFSVDFDVQDVCSIGLLPTGKTGAGIVDKVVEFSPRAIIIDGEPLMLQQLKTLFPAVQVISLLNPSDIDNPDNHSSHMAYFHLLYAMADMTIVHGLRQVDNPGKFLRYFSLPTILRREIDDLVRCPQKQVYCILGGGTVNVDESFKERTLRVAQLVIGGMSALAGYRLIILCGCRLMASMVRDLAAGRDDVEVCEELVPPSEYYSRAALVVTRAGRNTLSELVELGIPSIAFSTGCRFRTSEQKGNMHSVQGFVRQADLEMSQNDFGNMMKIAVAQGDVRPSEQVLDGRAKALAAIAAFLSLRGA